MSTDKRLDTLQRVLFGNSDYQLYGVLDAAAIPDLRSLLAQHQVPNLCLFHGDLAPPAAQVVPYLAELPPQSPFTELLLTQGVGNHWGILAHSGGTIRTLRTHFRTLLTVKDPDDRPLYFRYYDPRVLRVYLPTCDIKERELVFGPVTAYFAEADMADVLLRFTYTPDQGGASIPTLFTDRISI